MRLVSLFVLTLVLSFAVVPHSTALIGAAIPTLDLHQAAPRPDSTDSANLDSAYYCQCTDYVRQRFGLFSSIGWFWGAQDMGPYLQANGMVQVSTPQPGAIAVFPSWFGYGINAYYGHVAVVEQVYWNGDSAQLVLRGANQSWTGIWSEYGCANVSDLYHISHSPHYPYIAYYVWPAKLEITQPLTISDADHEVAVGEEITATFAFQNVGGTDITIETAMAGGRRGESWDAPTQANFRGSESIVLAPGAIYHYTGTFTPRYVGEHFVAPTLRIDGAWLELPDSNRVRYRVVQPEITAKPQIRSASSAGKNPDPDPADEDAPTP